MDIFLITEFSRGSAMMSVIYNFLGLLYFNLPLYNHDILYDFKSYVGDLVWNAAKSPNVAEF